MIIDVQLKHHKCGWEQHTFWNISQGYIYVHAEEKYELGWNKETTWNKETSISAWQFFISWQKIQQLVAQNLGSNQEPLSLENTLLTLGSQDSFARFPNLQNWHKTLTTSSKLLNLKQRVSCIEFICVNLYTYSLDIWGEKPVLVKYSFMTNCFPLLFS